MESRTGKAALQGSIVHQTMEWMAKLKKRGKTNVDPMWLLDRAWDEITEQSPHIEIRRVTTRRDRNTGKFKEAADFKRCRVALENILASGFYNPYNMKIIDVEQWFELEIPGEEWKSMDKHGELKQFSVRGLLDLVHEIDSDTIEIVDWKTGKRKSLYSQTPIDEEVLLREVQPRIYHLAAYFLYSGYKNIIITFYYANQGGPITISLSHDDIAMTLAFLYKTFSTIKGDTLMRRNRHWTCNMCSYDKGGVCHRVWSDLHTMGSQYVEDRYVNMSCEDQLEISKPKEV